MLRALTNSLYRFAFWIDERLRWFDLTSHRTEGTWLHRKGFVARYSPTALWLPIPVIVGISYGLLRWRGWALLLACAAAVLVHLAICKLAEGRRLPRLQWLLLSVLALGVFAAGWWIGGTEARPGVYPHLFGLFAIVMLTLGVPASRWWADLVIGRRRERYRAQFAERLGQTSLFVKYPRAGDSPPPPPVRILGALALVPVASPLLLAIVPAIVVVASPPHWVRAAGLVALAAWWLFLSFGHFQERLRAVQALLRQLFLVGTTGVLSLVVIAFAVTRLAGIDYVTTVLDQASGRTVLGTIALLYLVLWLYDYWMQRARAEVLLGLLTDAENHPWQIPYRRDARLQIHGAGRLSLTHPQIGVWDGLVARLAAIAEYVGLFEQAFPSEVSGPGDITIVHVGKGIGAFQADAFRADDSAFDRYLRGDKKAMSKNAELGMKLFYGKAECSSCHAGVFQTDHDFHAIDMPQIGPGFDPPEDFGREGFTGDSADRYRFRTPSLCNVVLTGPWGHNGFFNSLEAVVRHHLDPLSSLLNADPSQVVLPPRPDLDALDLVAFNDPVTTAAIGAAIEIDPPDLSEKEVGFLLDFLEALTDFSAEDARKTVPTRVPSGLPLAEIK